MTISLIPLGCALFFFAMVSCTSASRDGLPPGSPFAESAVLQPNLPQGIAIGDVTSHSAVLWLRTDGPKTVLVEWATVDAWDKTPLLATVQAPVMRTPLHKTGPEADFTLSIPLEGLAPATRYRFKILVDQEGRLKAGQPIVLPSTGEFTTLPDVATSAPLTFAWSGDLGGQERCRQGEGGYPIFDVIRRQRPDFFLFLGDTIYSDSPCPSPPNEPGADSIARSLPEYRSRHRYQRGAAALRRFLEAVPIYAIWDDHEVRDNFSGPSERLMPAGRQALREYWPIGTHAVDPHRLYRVVRYGADLELFILDTRQYRSRNSDLDGAGKTMLGSAQLAWLIQGLETSTATWKVVATSVPLSIPKPGPPANPGFDGWAGGSDGTGFEHERQVIVDAILSKGLKNVVFLGGDVHYVQANSYDPDGNGVADFHEFVAGPLSARPGRMTPPSPGLHPTSLVNDGGYFNFGLVRATRTSFEASFIDDTGKTRFSHRVQAQ